MSIDELMGLLGAPSVAGAVIALFGGLHWTAELFTHFRVQYFSALLFCALFLAGARRFRWAVFYGVAAVLNLSVVMPLYAGKSPDVGQPSDFHPAFACNAARLAVVYEAADKK